MGRGRLSRDEPAPGVVVYQPRRGFRYAMDPFFLAAWALEGGGPRHVVDLGSGSGIMALLLARLGIEAQGFDVRQEWIDLSRRSAAESGLAVRFTWADIRALPPARHDLALLNPPYLPTGMGPVSPDGWKAAARSELNGTLAELVGAAARQARRVCIVLPHHREREGVDAFVAAGMVVRRVCRVDPALVLLEARATAGEVHEERTSTREGDDWSIRVRGWYRRLGARLSPPGR